jgi:hypothetical protein
MDIALRKMTLSPVRLVLEDKSKRDACCCCFFAIGEYNPIQSNLILSYLIDSNLMTAR